VAWLIVALGALASVCACSAIWCLARPTREYGQCSIQDAPKPDDPAYARWVEECKLERLRADRERLRRQQREQARRALGSSAEAAEVRRARS
jgi:hypothetical protein